MFSFEGRIGRAEWWGRTMLLYIAGFIMLVVSIAIHPALAILVYIAFAISSWSIGSRRCHDLGWSGAMLLINLVPVFGALFLLVALGFVPGQSGPNRYGYADGYAPQYVDTGMSASLKAHDAAPAYLQRQSAIHPGLLEANERAWASTGQEYRP